MTSPPALPSLATPDDVVARLGRQLNQVENARVDALLADGSAHIRRYVRRDFIQYTDDVKVLPANGGAILLRERPVQSVSSVVAIGGAPGVPDLPVFWFVFDEVDTIYVPDPIHSGIINLAQMWYEMDWFGKMFRVQFSHGTNNVPLDVVAVLCTAVISMLTAPTMAGGLASETLGAYSYSMHRTAGSGMLAELKVAGMDSLGELRNQYGTIQVQRS